MYIVIGGSLQRARAYTVAANTARAVVATDVRIETEQTVLTRQIGHVRRSPVHRRHGRDNDDRSSILLGEHLPNSVLAGEHYAAQVHVVRFVPNRLIQRVQGVVAVVVLNGSRSHCDIETPERLNGPLYGLPDLLRIRYVGGYRQRAMAAPSSAICRAEAAPMPEPAPVISATLSLSRIAYSQTGHIDGAVAKRHRTETDLRDVQTHATHIAILHAHVLRLLILVYASSRPLSVTEYYFRESR
jgi:hypothetical protein